MKNIILVTFSCIALVLSNCTKNNKNPLCKTCTIDTSPDIRVELCDGISTTYSRNLVILEEDIQGLPISFYTSLLEASGYQCK